MSDEHEQPETYIRHAVTESEYDDSGRPTKTTTNISQHLPHEKCRGGQCGD